MFRPKQVHPPGVRYRRGGELFDGVIAFWVGKGDLIENLTGRIGNVTNNSSVAAPFVREILSRCQLNDTALRRLPMLSNQVPPPMISRENRRVIETLLANVTET